MTCKRWQGSVLPPLAACCSILFGGAPAAAQDPAALLEARHAGPDTLPVEAGARGSAAFRIANRGGDPVLLQLSVQLPAGWRLVPLPSDLELHAGEAAIRIVTFFAPANASAGVYRIALTVRDVTGASVVGDLRVRVPAQPRIDVEVETAPDWVMAGEAYTAVFRVSNRGNTILPVALGLENPEGWLARADASEFRLEPGESRRIEVLVETEDASDAKTRPLVLTARIVQDTVRAVAKVEVIPQGIGASRERGGMAASLRLRGGSDPRAGPPVRLRASGPVAHGSSTTLDLLLQGPSQAYSAFGETDEYRLRVRSPSFSIAAGDQRFRLSQLTEPGREGQGVQAHVTGEGLSAGGFAGRDRRSSPVEKRVGAYAGARAGPAAIRANWTRRESGHGTREVWSVNGTFRLRDLLRLDGEYGNRPANGSRGWSANLQGDFGPVDLSMRHLEVDAAFGGWFTGTSSDAGRLRIRPWRALFAEASFYDQRSAPGSRALGRDRRTLRLAAGFGTLLSLEGRQVEGIVDPAGPRESLSYRAARVRLGLPALGPLAVQSWYELGLGGGSGPTEVNSLRRVGARVNLRSGPAHIAGSLESFTGGVPYRLVVEEGISAELSAALDLGSSTRIRASARTARYTLPSERQNRLLDARLAHRLPSDHEFTLRFHRRSLGGGANHQETLLFVEYAIPLQLPIGRSPDNSRVVVRVFDGETLQPAPGVVVEVGTRRAATDEEGIAVVRGLPPGLHYVDIDRRTGGPSRVPTLPLPHPLEVHEHGHGRPLEIGLVPSGSLIVRSEILRVPLQTISGVPPAGSSGENIGAEGVLGAVVVDLVRDGERIRRTTDSRGRLNLRDLRPGAWTLSVASADLPSFYRFERDTVKVVVSPGEQSEVVLRAVPVERRVRVVASGSIAETDIRVTETPPDPAPLPTISADSLSAPLQMEGWSTFVTTAHTSTLFEVARRIYLQTSLWPKIWLANQELVPDPGTVPEGVLLKIPPKAPLSWEERKAHSSFLSSPNR